MIFKQQDDKSSELQALERCLALAGSDKKKQIEQDLRMVRAGIEGERDAAYHIDFYIKDRPGSGIIHDLRLELPDGRTAQIDHLLINRAYVFYVLETKSFKHGVKITEEGEFLRWNDWKKTYEGMASPLEQANRHALVLRKFMTLMEMPEPEVRCFTLVSSTARIVRPKRFDTSRVIKADQFFKTYIKDIDNLNIVKLLYNVVRSDPMADVARYIVGSHKPITFDYFAKYGLSQDATPPPSPAPAAPAPTAPAGATPSCRHCSSPEIAIQHGKYGYYFKCTPCDGNTPIKLACNAGHPERIRKERDSFYRECATCGTSALYFENAVTV